MAKKKTKYPIVKLIGGNATDVTGSLILVETASGKQILLECGIIQGGSLLDDYNSNKRMLDQVDFTKVSYIFVGHSHADHSMLIPRTMKLGFYGKVIVTEKTSIVLEAMLMDGGHINERNAKTLNKKYRKHYEPLYTSEDALMSLILFNKYGYDEIHKLDDEISFRFLRNSHVIGAASIELYIKDKSNHVYKIFYSSDLGNDVIKDRLFVDKTEYCRKANLAIFESTYGASDDEMTNKMRQDEIKSLEEEVIRCCVKNKGKIIMPLFSFSRTQELLTILYDLFKDNPDFEDIEFVIDSKLSSHITYRYPRMLDGEDKEKFEEVLEWENLSIISHFLSESLHYLRSSKPMVVLSSSGMCDFGHVKEYIKKAVGNPKNSIVFVGYTGEGTLARRLQEDNEVVEIDKTIYVKCANILTLNTFSSHIQKKQLVNYICDINAGKVILVHGSQEAKESLKEACVEKLREMNKTTNLIIGKKNLEVVVK